MAGLKLLLDTNIVIQLEDPKPLSATTADFVQRAQLHGMTLFAHEASLKDVDRDADAARRALTLSKLQRYPMLREVAHDEAELTGHFGPSKNDNDRCDALLLDALRLQIVDFLVSEDVGLHKRAARSGLGERTFRIADALAWLRRTFEPREVPLPYVLSKKAHQIPLGDPIFASLRADYEGFDQWYASKCRAQHRDCWVVEISGRVAGLLIRKDEQPTEAPTRHRGPKILKICTFKISPDFQGEKLGEHLLKKVLWFAQANHYDLLYVTAYPKQEFLIALLQQFGFENTGSTTIGEYILERPMRHEIDIQIPPEKSAHEIDVAVFPRYYDGAQVNKFVVPIRPEYHIVLFPEIGEAPPLPLFPEDHFVFAPQSHADRTPGNTIRKVYVCRAATRQLKPGDILVFYLSHSAQLTRSQCATSIGIVEKTERATSLVDLMRCVGRRSVYSQQDLTELGASAHSPVLVIDFLLIGHLQQPIPLPQLIEYGAVRSAPQSIGRVPPAGFDKLKRALSFSFS